MLYACRRLLNRWSLIIIWITPTLEAVRSIVVQLDAPQGDGGSDMDGHDDDGEAAQSTFTQAPSNGYFERSGNDLMAERNRV